MKILQTADYVLLKASAERAEVLQRRVEELQKEVAQADANRRAAEDLLEQVREDARRDSRELHKTIRKMTSSRPLKDEEELAMRRLHAQIAKETEKEEQVSVVPMPNEMSNRYDEIYGETFVPPPFREDSEGEPYTEPAPAPMRISDAILQE